MRDPVLAPWRRGQKEISVSYSSTHGFMSAFYHLPPDNQASKKPRKSEFWTLQNSETRATACHWKESKEQTEQACTLWVCCQEEIKGNLKSSAEKGKWGWTLIQIGFDSDVHRFESRKAEFWDDSSNLNETYLMNSWLFDFSRNVPYTNAALSPNMP